MTPFEALKRIRQETCPATILPDFDKEECCNIIEKALKEKEQQDSVLKILKDIIQFAQVLPHIEPNKDNGFDIMYDVSINIQRDIENKERELLRKWVLKTCFPKELKALEILKKYPTVPLSRVLQYISNSKKYGWTTKDHPLEIYDISYNEEEYELLKEVLK